MSSSPRRKLCGASGLLAIDEGVLVLGGGGITEPSTSEVAPALGVGDVDARSSGETMRGGVRGSEVRAEGGRVAGTGRPRRGTRSRGKKTRETRDPGRRRVWRRRRGDGEVARHGRDYRFRARYRRCGVQPEALRRGRGCGISEPASAYTKEAPFSPPAWMMTRTRERGGRRGSAGSDLAKTSVARCARRVETCGKPADAPTARSARRWRRAGRTRARASVVSLENESRRIGGATRRGRGGKSAARRA